VTRQLYDGRAILGIGAVPCLEFDAFA